MSRNGQGQFLHGTILNLSLTGCVGRIREDSGDVSPEGFKLCSHFRLSLREGCGWHEHVFFRNRLIRRAGSIKVLGINIAAFGGIIFIRIELIGCH